MRAERITTEEEKKELKRRGFLKAAGGVFALAGASWIGWELYKEQQRQTQTADLVEGSTIGFNEQEARQLPTQQLTTKGNKPTSTPFQPSEKVPTPESSPTPEVEKMSDGLVLKDTINLARPEHPFSMAIKLKSGRWLAFPIAKPWPYSPDNNKRIFHPSRHTIETYEANERVPTTWAHSGTWKDTPLFARNLELFLRKKPFGEILTQEESEELFKNELLGAKVYLFQGRDSSSFPDNFPVGMNIPEAFQGNILELEVTAGARIPRFTEPDSSGKRVDLVELYSQHPLDTYDWAGQRFPQSGFSNIDTDNLWGLKFCGGPLKDEVPMTEIDQQKYNFVPAIQYSRWLIGFKTRKDPFIRQTFDVVS